MVNSDLHPAALQSCIVRRILPGMGKRIYLREWRKFRNLTQDQVIERLIALDDPQLPQTGASLSRLENGKQPWGERILEALAVIYQCELWELIGRHPEKAGEVVSMFDELNERQKAQAIAVIEALKAAG